MTIPWKLTVWVGLGLLGWLLLALLWLGVEAVKW